MNTYKWQFAARFRRNTFGWKSQPPIQRIKEALAEIKAVAKKEPIRAAEGAVLLLEKLAPAIEHVDGSSGAIGSAVNNAIRALVPIIANADVDEATRQKWLERLWDAVQDDAMPYIESLGHYWGDLCVLPSIASRWANEFLPVVVRIWGPNKSLHGYFKGTTACMSALFAAGRHDELLMLLETARHKWWSDRRWGVKALMAIGKTDEALHYAESSRGLFNRTLWDISDIARTCEEILISSGKIDEAYGKFAIDANQATTKLATFRAIAKKYPHKPAETVLRDLIASQPGEEGKWFAAAKDAGLFELAIELVNKGPADPKTLIRAARDFAEERPEFALAVGMAGLHYLAAGYGYDITSTDVHDGYTAVVKATKAAGIPEATTKTNIRAIIEHNKVAGDFVASVLEYSLRQ